RARREQRRREGKESLHPGHFPRRTAARRELPRPLTRPVPRLSCGGRVGPGSPPMKSLAFLALAAAAAAALAADASQELAEKRAALAAKAAQATKSDLANEHYRLGVWAKDRGFEEDALLEFRA